MAHKRALRELVRTLRRRGNTYNEILQKINGSVSKSTLSLWCRSVPVPLWYAAKVEKLNKASLKRARERSRVAKEKYLSDLSKELRECNKQFKMVCSNKDMMKTALAMLYLGEGAKWRTHRGLMLGSSDPRIVLLYIRLLQMCYGIATKDLKCRVCYRADQNIRDLEHYWSQVTKVPMENFYKTKPDARTLGLPTRKKDYKGVCAVMCHGTRIQHELDIISDLILESLSDGPIA